MDVLVRKTFLAAEKFCLNRIVVGGGVSANSSLREEFAKRAAKGKVKVFFPSRNFSTDNAAMIALAGTYRYRHALDAGSSFADRLRVNPSLPFENWAVPAPPARP